MGSGGLEPLWPWWQNEEFIPLLEV